MEEAVLLTEPNGNAKQIRKMFRGQYGRFSSISEDAPFAQENHPLDLWNNFRNMMRDQQDADAGSGQLPHGVTELHLRADVQRVARLIK